MNLVHFTEPRKSISVLVTIILILINSVPALAQTDSVKLVSKEISLGSSDINNIVSEFTLPDPIDRPDLAADFARAYGRIMSLGEPDVEYDLKLVGYTPEQNGVDILYYNTETGRYRAAESYSYNGREHTGWVSQSVGSTRFNLQFVQGGGIAGSDFPYAIYVSDETQSGFVCLGSYLVYNLCSGEWPIVGTEFTYDWVVNIPETDGFAMPDPIDRPDLAADFARAYGRIVSLGEPDVEYDLKLVGYTPEQNGVDILYYNTETGRYRAAESYSYNGREHTGWVSQSVGSTRFNLQFVQGGGIAGSDFPYAIYVSDETQSGFVCLGSYLVYNLCSGEWPIVGTEFTYDWAVNIPEPDGFALPDPIDRPDLAADFARAYGRIMSLGEPDVEYDLKLVGYTPEQNGVDILYYNTETGRYRAAESYSYNGREHTGWVSQSVGSTRFNLQFVQGGGIAGSDFPYAIYVSDETQSGFVCLGSYLVYNLCSGEWPIVGTEFTYDWAVNIPEPDGFALPDPIDRPDLAADFARAYGRIMSLGEPDVEYDLKLVGYTPEQNGVDILYYNTETGRYRAAESYSYNGREHTGWVSQSVGSTRFNLQFVQGGGIAGSDFPYAIYVSDETQSGFVCLGSYLVYNLCSGEWPIVGTEFTYDWSINIFY